LDIIQKHKTRIRIWNSKDEEVGRRIEIANRIGVLEQSTDLASRFTVKGALHGATFYSEDNGYEAVPHKSGEHGISENFFPSQMSAFLRDDASSDGLQLSVALDRSHAVASLVNGTMEVVQHRRGGGWAPSAYSVLDSYEY
jgi:hypothetical protein